MSSDKQIAVVTGASGYVANHVIQKLLDKGYHVRGTVRNKAKAEKLSKLFPQLELFDADLLKDDSFDEVVKGATYVFHTASPFLAGQPTDPVKELVEPAVKGTLNVLKSVAKAGNIKRVVLTSSVAAIAGGDKPADHVFTENDWNTTSTAESRNSYVYSKKKAEESAWEFAKEHNIDLVSICPGFVVGPPLLASESSSLAFVSGYFKGEVIQLALSVVDVRNVAEAHVRAAEIPKASGRYILTAAPADVSQFELSQFLSKSGQFDKYDGLLKKDPYPAIPRRLYSAEKAKKELGLEFSPLDKALVDMAHKLIEFGLVERK